MKRLTKIAIVAAAGFSILFGADATLAANNVTAPSPKSFQNQKSPAPGASPVLQGSPPAQTKAIPPSAIAQDIRDIKGPISIPYPWLWACYAGGGALLLLIAWAVRRWLRNGKSFRVKSAHEIAFEQLERARALMRPEKAGAFSVAVSGAIRTYIENRFRLTATHYTTEEFMERLVSDRPAILSSHSEVLEDFLGHCDLAKFARYNLSVDQMTAMHQSAWQFVENTIPCAEDESSEQESQISGEDLVAVKDLESRSLLHRLWEKGHRLIPKKTIIPAGLNDGSAVVAGGGS